MSKLLIHSNSPWAPTGYGQQVATFVSKLAEKYDVAVSAFYGLEGARLKWDGIPIYPGLGGEFGNQYLPDHAQRHFGEPRGGMVLTLMDVWVLDSQMASQLNMVSWVPVDHAPAPPGVTNWFKKSGAIPIAMSKFGQEELQGFDPLYCPHGIDTEVYKPHDKDEIREASGVPEGAFVVGMVAANKGRPSRKGFQQAFEAFRAFRQRHEDAYLYLHTVMNPSLAGQGEELAELLSSLQIPAESVLLADQYRMLFDPFPAKTMARIYSTFDVLLNPSLGEGFGIPVLEAQACGVPAIVTDFSAMKEVCGAGWKVECRPIWTPQRSWQAVPDVEDIVESLERAHSLSPRARETTSDQARRHALNYNADKVFTNYLLPALEAAQERIDQRKPVKLAAA